MYRLFIVTPERGETFAIQNDDRDYLIDRGEEWLRMMFISAYYIVPSEEKT